MRERKFKWRVIQYDQILDVKLYSTGECMIRRVDEPDRWTPVFGKVAVGDGTVVGQWLKFNLKPRA